MVRETSRLRNNKSQDFEPVNVPRYLHRISRVLEWAVFLGYGPFVWWFINNVVE